MTQLNLKKKKEERKKERIQLFNLHFPLFLGSFLHFSLRQLSFHSLIIQTATYYLKLTFVFSNKYTLNLQEKRLNYIFIFIFGIDVFNLKLSILKFILLKKDQTYFFQLTKRAWKKFSLTHFILLSQVVQRSELI